MNIISEDIKDLLTDSSYGVGVFNQNLFVEYDPVDPLNRIVIYATGGFDPDPNVIFNPTFTVHIFNKDLLQGYTKCEEIRDILHNFNNQSINGTNYLHILMSGDINSLGKEDKTFKFFINFTAKR